MNAFNVINQEYVPYVDIETLGNSFNTLEQGHQQAVQAASTLKQSIAALPMHSNEDGFKQQLLNSIEQNIETNTIYGNSYYALDDLVAQQGDIMSNPAVLGRVNAYNSYQSFVTSISENENLPERYKQFFLEVNPYHYEDKYDDKGNIIGGSGWSPNISPNKVVDLNPLMREAVEIAGREYGYSNITRYFDKNGNITNNIMEAFDGEYLDSTTNTWEKLPIENIIGTFMGLLQNNPEALASVEQDWMIDVYDNQKLVAQNGGTPVVSNVTDAQGNLLSVDQYITQRILPFAEHTAYTKVTPHITHGNGATTFRKFQEKLARQNNFDPLQGGTPGSTWNMEFNEGVEVMGNMTESKDVINGIVKQITGKDFNFKDGVLISMNDIDPDGKLTDEQRMLANDYILQYNNSIEYLRQYTSVMNSEDKARYEAALRLASGGEIISSGNGGSKEEDAMINIKNYYKEKGIDTIKIDFKDDDELKMHFKDLLMSEDFERLQNAGLTITDNYASISVDSPYFVMCAGLMDRSENRRNQGPIDTIFGEFGPRYAIEAYNKNGNKIEDVNLPDGVNYGYPGDTSVFNGVINNFRKLGEIYTDLMDSKEDINTKYNITSDIRPVMAINLRGNTWDEQKLITMVNNGEMDVTTYNTIRNFIKETLPNVINNIGFENTIMYKRDEDGNGQRIVSSVDRMNEGEELLKWYKAGTITPTLVSMPGKEFGIVYKGVDDKGHPVEYFIQDSRLDSSLNEVRNLPLFKATENLIRQQGNYTVQTLTNTDAYPELGETKYRYIGNNMYAFSMLGTDVTVNLNQMAQLTKSINEYKAVKQNAVLNNGEIGNGAFVLGKVAETIGNTLNVNPNAIYKKLVLDCGKYK